MTDDGVQAKAAALFASRVPEKAWPIVDKLTSDSSKTNNFRPHACLGLR